MQLRRPLALMTGALVLSLGGLTSCGFDLATDQPYTPGDGTNASDGGVDVLAAVVVAAQPNEGTLVLTLVNNSETDISLNGVAGAELEVDDFEPVEVAPGDAVNLAEEGGILVAGDFDAGQMLPLTLTYADGNTIGLNVPVVTACDHYEGLDLTEDSEFIPYDCEFEAPPAGGEGH
ncbi:copper chaperone PCu(A)C [Nocardioides dilutus]